MNILYILLSLCLASSQYLENTVSVKSTLDPELVCQRLGRWNCEGETYYDDGNLMKCVMVDNKCVGMPMDSELDSEPVRGGRGRLLRGDPYPIYNTDSPRSFCFQFGASECEHKSMIMEDGTQIDCKMYMSNCIVDDHMHFSPFDPVNNPGMGPPPGYNSDGSRRLMKSIDEERPMHHLDDHPEPTPEARRQMKDEWPIYNTNSPWMFCDQFGFSACPHKSWMRADGTQVDCKWEDDACVVDDHQPKDIIPMPRPGHGRREMKDEWPIYNTNSPWMFCDQFGFSACPHKSWMRADGTQVDCKWEDDACVVDDHQPKAKIPMPRPGHGRREMKGEWPIYNTNSPWMFCDQFGSSACPHKSWMRADGTQVDCKWEDDACVVDDHQPDLPFVPRRPGGQ